MEFGIGSILLGAFGLFAGIMVISFVLSSIVTTEQNTKRVIERFGRFVGVRGAGMSGKLGWFDKASKPISLRTQQLDIVEGTYTDKGTSVTIGAQVQYKVDENDESVKNAYYKLSSPEAQIKSHVSSAIRAKVPTMSLESVQTNQRDIASFVKTELTQTMAQYGYVIEDVLITKADPDPTVVKANNDKYAAEQGKITAQNLAEANYTKVTRQAEAERDAMKAHGQGIALERQAITDGLEKSIETLKNAVPGATVQDVLKLVAFQQYVDAQVKIAGSAAPGTKVIFMDGGATATGDLMQKLGQTLISSTEAGKPTAVAPAVKAE